MKMKISTQDKEIDGNIGCNPPFKGIDFGLRLMPTDNNNEPNILALLDVKECEALIDRLAKYLEVQRS